MNGGPTSGVKRSGGANAGPDGSLETHGLRDRADTVVNIAVGRAPEGGGDTEHVLDDLLGPSELGDDLLVGERGHRRVAPSVDSNLMPSHVLLLEESRVGDGTRTNDEEGSLKVDGVEVLKQVTGVEGRTIVVSETPSHLIGALDDIVGISTSTTGPPASTAVRNCLRVGRTSTSNGCGDVGDSNTRRGNLLDPLLDLGRVRWGGLVQGGVAGRTERER